MSTELLDLKNAVNGEGDVVPADDVVEFQFPERIGDPYTEDTDRLEAEGAVADLQDALAIAQREDRFLLFMPGGQPVFDFIRSIGGLNGDTLNILEKQVVAHNRGIQVKKITGQFASRAVLAPSDGVSRAAGIEYDLLDGPG